MTGRLPNHLIYSQENFQNPNAKSVIIIITTLNPVNKKDTDQCNESEK